MAPFAVKYIEQQFEAEAVRTLRRLPSDEQMMVFVNIYNGVVIISRLGYPSQPLLHIWRKRRLKQSFP